MSMFRNVMVYLGLGPDEEYDDSYLYEDDQAEPTHGEAGGTHRSESSVRGPSSNDEFAHSAPYPASNTVGAPSPVASSSSSFGGSGGTVGSVRPIRPAPSDDEPGFRVRAMSSGSGSASGDSHERTVRAVPIQRSKPRAISPQSFGDAKILADEFKRQIPVVMNIQDADRELARRLIDFSSGVCYALGGSMDKLASNVFLLTPKGVEVSDDDRRRIEERGFDR